MLFIVIDRFIPAIDKSIPAFDRLIEAGQFFSRPFCVHWNLQTGLIMKYILFFLSLAMAAGCGQQSGADPFTKMEADITNGVYPGIHSVLISRNDSLLYEHYWPGKDLVMGQDVGVIA